MNKKLECSGNILFDDGEYQIIDCHVCGFAHCMPIPLPAVVNELYSKNYYTSVKPKYISEVENDAEWHRMTFRARIKQLEQLVSGRRLLEVGSGPGFFLAEAKARGWTEQGYELNVQAYRYSTQHLEVNVKNCQLPTHLDVKFDAAYMGLVLEHIPNPEEMLRRVHNALLPTGVLCISVPNDFSALQQKIAKYCHLRQWWISPPHHINYFTFQSICRLLKTCGFTILRQEGTFPLELFCLLGLDYISQAELGRKAHALRKKIEFTMELCGLQSALHDVYATLASHGLGRECVIFASKDESLPSSEHHSLPIIKD